MTGLDYLAKVTTDLKSGKSVIKEPKMPRGGDIPEGWHVVQMYINDDSVQLYIYLVLEEN